MNPGVLYFRKSERLRLFAAAVAIAPIAGLPATWSGWLLAAMLAAAALGLVLWTLTARARRAFSSPAGRRWPALAVAILTPGPVVAAATVAYALSRL